MGIIRTMDGFGGHATHGRVIGVRTVILVRTTAPGDPIRKASP
jgi:hypothetical protein